MGYYSFIRPPRDGRLNWPCWLTYSRRFTHKVVKRPSISLAQASSPARIDVLTTMLRHQLIYNIVVTAVKGLHSYHLKESQVGDEDVVEVDLWFGPSVVEIGHIETDGHVRHLCRVDQFSF